MVWRNSSDQRDAISQFPDPLHLGSHFSFIVATCSDGFFSILVVAGLATRWAALLIFCNIFVAWALVVHLQFFAHGVRAGEAMVLYLGGFITVALAGPERFSVDASLERTAEDDGNGSSRVQNRQSSRADRFALQTLRNATFGAEAVV